jgi:RimJ/RimL family protein N-acetyltransferase
MHAQKCGFTYEGRLRKSVKKDGKFLDQLLYGLLRSDIADAPDA